MRNSFQISITLVCAFALGLSGCGTNPVTGKKEIQFVSEAQEVQMGEQNYAPTRQSEGGDFTILPELFRIGGSWRYFVFGVLIVLMMVVRPEGIVTRDLVRRLSPFGWRSRRAAGSSHGR